MVDRLEFAHPVAAALTAPEKCGTREYLQSFEAFRGIAITLIILCHLDPSPTWFKYLTQNATVFFVFISGFLFSHLYDEKQTIWSFWFRKAQRLILPYAVATLPGALYVFFIEFKGTWIGYPFWTFVTGVGHLNDAHWFIPFAVLVFSLYPLLRILQRNVEVLMAATACLLLVSVFSFRSANNANPLLNLVHFGGIFLVGMLASR